MSLVRINDNELKNEIKGEEFIKNKRCIITRDYENSDIIYVYDAKTKKLIHKFDSHGQHLDYLKVTTNGKVGIFLISGCNMYVPAVYKDIDMRTFIHYEKKEPFFAQIENNKYIVLDFYGSQLNSEEYDIYEPFIDGFAVVAKRVNGELKYGIIKVDGVPFFECKFSRIYWKGMRKIGQVQTESSKKYFCKDTKRLFDRAEKISEKNKGKKNYETTYILEDYTTKEKFLYVSE